MSIENLKNLANQASVEYADISAGMSDNYASKDAKKIEAELPRDGSKTPKTKKAKKSLFNNFHVFSGDSTNVYVDEDLSKINRYKNPTVQNLVNNKQGANRFDYSDFVYAKRFGEIPNNRLITLRRFKYPVYDNIFGRHEPDIARMVTWFDGQDNNLNEIFKMSFGMSWRQLTAEMESIRMEGDPIGYSGVIGKILDEYISPNTNPQEYYDPKHDSNKVYGPVDSIHQTHIRDIGLNFSQDITLKFRYELRSIDGVNPKTAFMDLLSHILVCTMNDGKFWGGSRYWNGRPPSQYASRIRHWSMEKFAEFTQRSNVNIKSMLSSLASTVKNIDAAQVANMAMQILKNMAISKILDVAGRASVPLMNSLLSSDPVGEWHLTVGNPLRPIFVAGNLILEGTEIEIDDSTLGYDDFPTGLIVTCRLKHAMARDRAGIEKMFSLGNSRQYWKPTTASFKQITDAKVGKYVKESMQGQSLGNIAVVSRELYSFAATQLYGYNDSAQPKASSSATPAEAPKTNKVEAKPGADAKKADAKKPDDKKADGKAATDPKAKPGTKPGKK